MDTTPEYCKPKLSVSEALTVIGMLKRGDRQSDVAAWFEVSPSTINKIWKRRSKWLVDSALPAELPPAGPYQLVAKAVISDMETRATVAAAIVSELERLLRKYGTVAGKAQINNELITSGGTLVEHLREHT